MAAKVVEDKFRVVAVLVTHNGALWLPEVVAALGSQTRPIDFISAIDTGSTDSSTKLLKSARIPFITTEPDVGYGHAVSLAMQTLPECQSDEWIWLIHDDSHNCLLQYKIVHKLLWLDPNFLVGMIELTYLKLE
jgi:GT2 family glycosyltransferase